MAAAPGVWSRNDAPDYVLHEWIMAWVAHQIVADPLHLFDANIFYPGPLYARVLGSSDPAVADGGAAHVERRFPGAGPQPRTHGRFRPDRVDDRAGRRRLDRQPHRRGTERLAAGLQLVHADPAGADAGPASRVLRAGALRARSLHRDHPDEGRVEARRLVRAAGARRHLRDALHRHLAGRGRRPRAPASSSGRAIRSRGLEGSPCGRCRARSS